MKQFKKLTLVMVIIFSVFLFNLYSAEKVEVNKTFKPAATVEIKTVSGDCIFKIGNDSEIKVSLVHNYSADAFEPIFKEEGNTLILEEKFKEGKKCNDGSSTWTVTVPAKTNIDFHSVSGDFTAGGLKGNIRGAAVSGDVNLDNLNGNLDVEAVSGDINVNKVEGELKSKAVSGDINISDAILKGASAFKCISGDIEFKLAKTAEYDMEFSTVSGDINLDYNGNPIKGYFKFKGQKGNISSPIPFENSEESDSHNPFVKKYFKKDGDSPKISMETISGDLTLKK
jgi:hypothetical protein